MRRLDITYKALLVSAAMLVTIYSLQAQQKATATVVPVKMTVKASVAGIRKQ